MSCERIKDLILTDYIDGAMNENVQKLFDQHLSVCPDCKEYLSEVRQTVVNPFQKTESVSLSQDRIWLKIKDEIEIQPSYKEKYRFNINFIREIKDYVFHSGPAFALGAIAVLLVFTFTWLRPVDQKYAQTQGSDEVLTYVSEVFAEYAQADNDDEPEGYGTQIEEYFL